MRVKYLAQEDNAVPQSGLEPGPPDLDSSALTIRPPRLPNHWVIGGVKMILGRLSYPFTLAPSCGSVFVYMISLKNVIPEQVIPVGAHHGS